jgi:nucleotide-binding universal stress UspA family protein
MTAKSRTTLVAYDASATAKAAVAYAVRRLEPSGRLVGADEIVIGSRGRSDRYAGPALGSVSEAVLREADVPVVVVPRSR